jgi:Leucine-rich repeat (LRR) protein
VPTSIGNISGLVLFAINDNDFEGTLSSEIGMCSALNSLYIDGNHLTGPIPSNLGTLTKLIYFSANVNSLTGSLPYQLLRLPVLVYFQVTDNLLTGPEPLELGMGHLVTYVEGQSNRFSGNIPGNWSGFFNLSYVLLDENYISGTIPASFGLNLSIGGHNVKLGFGAQISMVEFSISSNLLRGSIPASVATHTALTLVSLSSNSLTGTLPSELSQLISLQTLNLSSNALEGTVLSTLTHELSYISLSDNAFTGVIPAALFESSNLTVIDLSTNCFSGSLPVTLCSPQSLTAMIMNGLSSGESCRVKFSKSLSRIFQGILSTQSFSASLPSCIFDLVHLETLQLAGNGMVGSLPNLPVPVNLTNIVLSSNRLVGTIPATIQRKGTFTTLGLQHNRLSGTLVDDFNVIASNVTNETAYTTLTLRINRLSGPLPDSFHDLPDLTVLEGNLFSCGSSKELPVHDPDADTYSCGSNNFNVSLYIWVGAVGIVMFIFFVGLVIVFVLTKSNTDKRLRQRNDGSRVGFKIQNYIIRVYFNTLQWYYFKYPSGRQLFSNTFQFLTMLKRSGSGMILLSFFYVCVCMISYIVMKSASLSTSTTYYQYGWILTTVYMHGATPVVLVILYFTLSVVLIAARIRSRRRKTKHAQPVEDKDDKIPSADVKNTAAKAPWAISLPTCWLYAQHILAPILCHTVNGGVSLYVNAMYVKIFEFEHVSPQQQLAVELMLSAFKLIWAATFVPSSMRFFQHVSSAQRLCHQVFMLCTLIIVAPMLASAAGSLSCFYNLFVPSSPIESTYQTGDISTDCIAQVFAQSIDGYPVTVFLNRCISRTTEATVSTTSNAPFVYSYQCGSAILSIYIPVFMYSYIFSCLFLPISRILLLHMSQTTLKRILPRRVYEGSIVGTLYDCEDMIESNVVASTMTAVDATTGIAKQLSVVAPAMRQSKADCEVGRGDSELGKSISKSKSFSIGRSLSYFRNDLTAREVEVTPLFDGSNVVAKRLLDFAVMLTFGLACPMLGLAVAFSVFANAGVWRIMIGKYLGFHATHKDAQTEQAFRNIEASSEGLLSGSKIAMWVVTYVGSIFWSLMLFDMTADIYGKDSGLIVVYIMLFVLPVLIFLILRGFDCMETRLNLSKGSGLLRSNRQDSLAAAPNPSMIEMNDVFNK